MRSVTNNLRKTLPISTEVRAPFFRICGLMGQVALLYAVRTLNIAPQVLERAASTPEVWHPVLRTRQTPILLIFLRWSSASILRPSEDINASFHRFRQWIPNGQRAFDNLSMLHILGIHAPASALQRRRQNQTIPIRIAIAFFEG